MSNTSPLPRKSVDRTRLEMLRVWLRGCQENIEFWRSSKVVDMVAYQKATRELKQINHEIAIMERG